MSLKYIILNFFTRFLVKFLFIGLCLSLVLLLDFLGVSQGEGQTVKNTGLKSFHYTTVLLAAPTELTKPKKVKRIKKAKKGPRLKIATLAGGCFWCVEAGLEKLAGVHEVISGYTGGHSKNPTYKSVSADVGGHVEAVQVHYDPKTISYAKILYHFWRVIDPTDNGGQFADRGASYRPFIFYHNARQKRIALQSRQKISKSGRFKRPLRVPIVAYKKFYKAEGYHQDYYKKNPEHYKRYFYGSGRASFIKRVWGRKK